MKTQMKKSSHVYVHGAVSICYHELVVTFVIQGQLLPRNTIS